MAGHSKWANIKHKKERADKKKGKLFSRLAKEIISAAKQGGNDPKTNSKLRLVIQKAKDANLPNDVAVWSIEVAEDNFHPRYDAYARHYQYRIFCEETRQPIRERYSWRVWPELNLDLLEAGAHHFLGTHDFAAFGSPQNSGGSTIRTIYSAIWSRDDEEVVFDIEGNAFLYRMVRRIVFFMVKIGHGKVDPDKIQKLLQPGKNSQVQGLAPSCGLNLVHVDYSS